jgi:hypothetical protein
MTPDEQKYYDEYLEMFCTEGWRQFVNDLQGSIEDLERNAIASLRDEQSLYRLKGRLEALTQMRNFEDSIKASYESEQE